MMGNGILLPVQTGDKKVSIPSHSAIPQRITSVNSEKSSLDIEAAYILSLFVKGIF